LVERRQLGQSRRTLRCSEEVVFSRKLPNSEKAPDGSGAFSFF
jgi:hypothetical protein